MRNIKIYLIIALLFMQGIVNGQSLPNVFPPSPSASMLAKYIEYPVSNSTGIPDISIPLYTINTGKISVPVSISYHSAGRKTSDITGSLGIGWTLQAGGMIARTVHGRPDDDPVYSSFPNPLKSAYNSSIRSDYEVLAGIMYRSGSGVLGTLRDSEYDLFSYLYPGGNGNFILKNEGSDKVPVTIPYKALKITYGRNARNFSYIEITDLDGTLYRFGKSLTTGAENVEVPPYTFYTADVTVSGWYLSEIISSDKTDTVSFNYEIVNQKDNSSYVTKTRKSDPGYNSILSPNSYYTYNIDGVGEEIIHIGDAKFYKIQCLTEIKFNGGKVKFSLQTGTNLITKIDVFNNTNAIIKTIGFSRSILDSPGPSGYANRNVETLDGVSFKDAAANTNENYLFNYYPSNLSNWDDQRHKDFWGYLSVGATYFPTITVPIIPLNGIVTSTQITTGNRNPNSLDAQRGVLKSITYPTGGVTEFYYEGNKYLSSDGTVKDGGGLRIGQIKASNNNIVQSIKTYKYGYNECGYGTIPLEPNIKYLLSDVRMYDLTNPYFPSYAGSILPYCNFKEITVNSEFSGDIAYFIQKPIGYGEVTEYDGDIISIKNGKTVYAYDVKTYSSSDIYNRKHIYDYNLWSGGYLKRKTTHKYNNVSSNYDILREEDYNYNPTSMEQMRGMHVIRPIVSNANGGNGNNTYYFCGLPINANGDALHPMEYYTGAEYIISTGINLLTYSTIKDHLPSGIITTSKQYFYNNNKLIASEITTNSKGEAIEKKYAYASDFSSQAPYNTMVQKNMLSPIIEQSTYKNTTTFLQSTKTNYNYWKNNSWGDNTANIIVPQTIESKWGNNASEVKVSFTAYNNKGNILEMQRSHGVKEVYLWGYKEQYPVAKIVDSDYATVSSVVTQTQMDAAIISGEASLRTLLNTLRTDNRTKHALTTTYTYTPLTGITSLTDPKGSTTTYKYDSFQRLTDVKNQNGNIVKLIDYHYKGQ